MSSFSPQVSRVCRSIPHSPWMRAAWVLGTLALMLPAVHAAADPEPGPEDGGLRLRLVATPRSAENKEGFAVRIDLVNASQRTITVQAGWEDDDSGSVKDYFETATSIECVPALPPWIGGVQAKVGGRSSPQPTHVLKSGETLSASWQTSGRQLKNRVSDPTVVQNPTFPFPGLYSVHASVDFITSEGTVRLRSNEQLVAVGGSRAMPRHTYGPLWSINGEQKTATLGLGSLHKLPSATSS
ncbi:MAG: hypothetical protein ACR2FY_14440 [Pirellulaceae bacterium]